MTEDLASHSGIRVIGTEEYENNQSLVKLSEHPTENTR